ncbi:MAG: hypothetical protein WDN06_14840 [Asticcacaulis sp.]
MQVEAGFDRVALAADAAFALRLDRVRREAGGGREAETGRRFQRLAELERGQRGRFGL